jgi:hypothetical protein
MRVRGGVVPGGVAPHLDGVLSLAHHRSPSAPWSGSEPPADAARSVAALVLLSGVSAALLAQGAYYEPGQWVLGLALVAAAVVMLHARGMPRDALAVPITASALLASWGVLRGIAEPSPLSGIRLALLGLAVATTLAVVRRLGPDGRAVLLRGLLAVGGLVALAGWAGVVWHLSPLALTNDGVWRAASTLTYANATAAVLGPLALLLLGNMTALRPDPARAVLLTLLLVGTAATLSRAGVLGLVAGGVVLTVLFGVTRLIRAALAPVVGAGVALLGLLPSMPTASAAGRPVAVAALVCGLAAAAWLSGRTTRGIARALLAVAGLVVAVGLLVGPHAVLGSIGEVADWRAQASSPARADAARAAVALAVDHPLVGVGPGDGWTSWRDPDGTRATMRYVHDEYLQVLVDVGLPGLLLTLVVLVGSAASLRAARRSRPSDGLVVGAGAALAAAAVHAAFDFVWHVPAVPVLLAAIVGIGFGSAGSAAGETGRKGEGT